MINNLWYKRLHKKNIAIWTFSTSSRKALKLTALISLVLADYGILSHSKKKIFRDFLCNAFALSRSNYHSIMLTLPFSLSLSFFSLSFSFFLFLSFSFFLFLSLSFLFFLFLSLSFSFFLFLYLSLSLIVSLSNSIVARLFLSVYLSNYLSDYLSN